MKFYLTVLSVILFILPQARLDSQSQPCIVIEAPLMFDGNEMLENKAIVVTGRRIEEVVDRSELANSPCKKLQFEEGTILPGLIEGHSHMLLHPYNETSWNDQVLKESHAERAIRGAIHAEKTLLAGFTTSRDLGSEGAGYVDVGLKQAIQKGVTIGPRLLVAGKAIVSTGSYGPKGFASHVNVPLGAEVADGVDDLTRVVRDQIGKGADLIKVYADYRWGPGLTAMPTFTVEELKLIVDLTQSSGREVVAHAASEEGMMRAAKAGVRTIEHGDHGTREVFQLMKKNSVALCPTLAAPDAILQYRGWKKGVESEPQRILDKRRSFQEALEVGVIIVAGGDVGVFDHGDNVRELELMVEYGMPNLEVLRSATSVNATVFDLADEIGYLKKGLLADIIVVDGNPLNDISALRKMLLVMKDGKIVSQ